MILRHQLRAEALFLMRIHAVIANLTSSTLAVALALAPTAAVAAPAKGDAAPAEDAAPEGDAAPAEGATPVAADERAPRRDTGVDGDR